MYASQSRKITTRQNLKESRYPSPNFRSEGLKAPGKFSSSIFFVERTIFWSSGIASKFKAAACNEIWRAKQRVKNLIIGDYFKKVGVPSKERGTNICLTASRLR